MAATRAAKRMWKDPNYRAKRAATMAKKAAQRVEKAQAELAALLMAQDGERGAAE